MDVAELKEWSFPGEALRDSVLFHHLPVDYELGSFQLQNERQMEQIGAQFASEAKLPSHSTDPVERNLNGGSKHWNLRVIYYVIYVVLMEKNLTDTNEENKETEYFYFTYF